MLLARLPAPLKPAAMLLVQPSFDLEDAEQSTYEHVAQQRAPVRRPSPCGLGVPSFAALTRRG